MPDESETIELARRDEFHDLQQGRLMRIAHWRAWRSEGQFTQDFGSGESGQPWDILDCDGPKDERVWFVSDYCIGSDYNGGSVTQSNHRLLLAACVEAAGEGAEQTFFQALYGSHGSYGIALHVDKTPREIFEYLAALENHPCIDESDLSELESEQEQEAWERWARRDYSEALGKLYGGDMSEVSDDDLFAHFREACETSNTYWVHQSDGPYIDIKRIIERGADADDERPVGFVAEEEEQDGAA